MAMAQTVTCSFHCQSGVTSGGGVADYTEPAILPIAAIAQKGGSEWSGFRRFLSYSTCQTITAGARYAIVMI